MERDNTTQEKVTVLFSSKSRIPIRFAPFRSPEMAAEAGDTAMTSFRTFNHPFSCLRQLDRC